MQLSAVRALWRINTPELDWQSILLDEAGEREHVLSEDEERRLFDALRPDFRPMARFALVTGARLGNVIDLPWRQVDWDVGTIAFRMKSKKPGCELHYLPITPAVAAILSRERGRHQERVFTYVCVRNRYESPHQNAPAKGRAAPLHA